MLNLVGSVGGGNHNLIAFRSLRTLRALRPLRAIPRWQGMKVADRSIISFYIWTLFFISGYMRMLYSGHLPLCELAIKPEQDSYKTLFYPSLNHNSSQNIAVTFHSAWSTFSIVPKECFQ